MPVLEWTICYYVGTDLSVSCGCAGYRMLCQMQTLLIYMTVERHATCRGPSILVFQSSCLKGLCGMIAVGVLSIDETVVRCREISCCCQFVEH